MAVTVSTVYRVIPFGVGDPRLPESKWEGHSEVTADATGGAMTAEILAARLGRLYSIEQVMPQGNAAVVGDLVLNTGMTLAGQVFGVQWRHRVDLILTSTGSINTAAEQILPPHFGGLIFQPDVGAADFPIVQWALGNVAGRNARVSAWGWVWSIEALKQIGGPIRPFTLFPLPEPARLLGRAHGFPAS